MEDPILDDPQQLRVYEAQSPLIWTAPRLRTIRNCRAYVNVVLADERVRELFPLSARTPIAVSGTKGVFAEIMPGEDAWMKLPGGPYRTDVIVLHELAHQFTYELFGDEHLDTQDHGPEFCGIFLWCVERFCGRHRRKALERTFADLSVGWLAFASEPVFNLPVDFSFLAA